MQSSVIPVPDATYKPVDSQSGPGFKSYLEYLEHVTKQCEDPRYTPLLEELRQGSNLSSRLYASLRATRVINVLSSGHTQTESATDISTLRNLLSTPNAAALCQIVLLQRDQMSNLEIINFLGLELDIPPVFWHIVLNMHHHQPTSKKGQFRHVTFSSTSMHNRRVFRSGPHTLLITKSRHASDLPIGGVCSESVQHDA